MHNPSPVDLSAITTEFFQNLILRRNTTFAINDQLDANSELSTDEKTACALLGQLLSDGSNPGKTQKEIRDIAASLSSVGINAHSLRQVSQEFASRADRIDSSSGTTGGSSLPYRVFLKLDHLHQSALELEDLIQDQLSKTIDSASRLASTTSTSPDFIRTTLNNLLDVDGILSAAFVRPDQAGIFCYEFQKGDLLMAHLERYHQGKLPTVTTNPSVAVGQGPAGRAWRSCKPQTSALIDSDPTMAPWCESYKQIGIRSTMALPIVDAVGNPIANVSLYSRWMGYFDNYPRLRSFGTLSLVMGNALGQHGVSQITAIWERDKYLALLKEGKVEMMFQPIVHLGTGAVVKFEALARLVDSDGSFIFPTDFLVSFGADDLLKLFDIGVAQGLSTLQLFADNGVTCELNINLPPSALTDQRYPDLLLDHLRSSTIDPSRIILEITEEEEVAILDHSPSVLSQLERCGVRLAQDDLGAGYSSLRRLSQFGFHEVKLDQALIQSAKPPRPSLALIYHLVQLVTGLDMVATVEGIETEELLEAVTILGADFGQGYVISRPLNQEQALAWALKPNWQRHVGSPKTALGALAFVIVWSNTVSSVKGNLGMPVATERIDELRLNLFHFQNREILAAIRAIEESFKNGITGDGYRVAMDALEAALIDHLAPNQTDRSI